VVLPRHNQGALDDVPEEVRSVTEFVFVESVEEALQVALPVTPRAEEALPEAPPAIH
jgi:ATP-dependent Lon protease